MRAAWTANDVPQNLSGSICGNIRTQSSISGVDANISRPVQNAGPDMFGGDIAEIIMGANFLFTEGTLKHTASPRNSQCRFTGT